MKKRIFEKLQGKQMGKRAAGAAALAVGILLAGAVSMESRATDPIKSQGNIHFDNSTPNDTSDDVYIHSGDLTYLNDKVEEQITLVTNGKNQLAQTAAGKGSPVTAAGSVPTFQELRDAVADIGTRGTAGAADVLRGKTIYNGTGYTTGSMKNHAGQPIPVENIVIDGDQGKIKIPDPGYYDGDTEIVFDIDVIRNDVANLTGNAETNQVLAGRTFYKDDAENKLTGTMADHSGNTQTAAMAASGTTGTVSIPAEGYYNTSSRLTVDLSSFSQQVERTTRQNTFKRIANVNFTMADSTAVKTIDCTSINGWENLTRENFFLVPTNTIVEFYNPSGQQYNFKSSLGNLNDPAKNKYSYDPRTGILTVVGNGTFGHITNSQDVVQVWYDQIDVYLWRK